MAVTSTRAVEETKEEEKEDVSVEVENNNDENDKEEEPLNLEHTGLVFKVYKSTRLKGYITLVLASGINYDSAKNSDDEILNDAQQATVSQRRYAMAVALVNLILSLMTVLAHLDRYSPLKKCWEKAFKKQSMFELGLLLFLLAWTITATWIQTSVKGIAGDGKGQYNLYFSTWASLWISAWTLERWMRFAGLASFSSFNASWPNRAPGWIMVFILSLSTLLCYIDLYVNWDSDRASEALRKQYSDVSQGQWSWLIIAATVTVPSSLAFVLVEIFRENRPTMQDALDGQQRPQEQASQVRQGQPNQQQQQTSAGESGPTQSQEKSELENILEGFVLLILFLAWVPTLIIATSPGGAASLVGNAYFFTWATTVFVLETAVWWIHDWRKRIHTILQTQEEEYRRIQEEVLKKSQETALVGTPGGRMDRKQEAHDGDNEQSGDDDDDDDEFADAEESEDVVRDQDDDDKYELYYE